MKILEIPNIKLDALSCFDPKRYPFLLESASHNNNNRYSILFAFPNESIVLNNLNEFNFLTKLEAKIDNKNIKSNLPFCGGWFVYLSYELIGQIEPILKNQLPISQGPIAIATRIFTAVITDHLYKKTYIIDEFGDKARINQLLVDIANLNYDIDESDFLGELFVEDENKFLSAIKVVRDYIIAGDVFQVNISRQWQYKLVKDIDAAQIYKKLKKSNPAPFSALANFENYSIISSSPERLFCVNGNTIQTRPIAGTYPRGRGAFDKKLKKQLINHPKERAEHIMLLDLERNDLGKVCKYGSICVDEIMTLESYPYVHHIVSNIRGKLKINITIKHLISALFPGGTITGCPKIRCMQIISELEKVPRQAYTGSIGYISSNGRIDFNILIRTIVKQNLNLSLRTGAGIVFDSNFQSELEETKHKAQGLLNIFKTRPNKLTL